MKADLHTRRGSQSSTGGSPDYARTLASRAPRLEHLDHHVVGGAQHQITLAAARLTDRIGDVQARRRDAVVQLGDAHDLHPEMMDGVLAEIPRWLFVEVRADPDLHEHVARGGDVPVPRDLGPPRSQACWPRHCGRSPARTDQDRRGRSAASASCGPHERPRAPAPGRRARDPRARTSPGCRSPRHPGCGSRRHDRRPPT